MGKQKVKNLNRKDSQAKNRKIRWEVLQYKPKGCICFKMDFLLSQRLHSVANNTVVHILFFNSLPFYLNIIYFEHFFGQTQEK